MSCHDLTSCTPRSLTSFSVLLGGNFIASGISSFITMTSSALILTSSVPPTSHVTHVSLQESVSLSTKHMQFCNTTTQIMVAFCHHMKQDTPLVNILHCIKLITAVFGFYIKQFKITNKQPPWRTHLPHTIMAALLVQKFLAF